MAPLLVRPVVAVRVAVAHLVRGEVLAAGAAGLVRGVPAVDGAVAAELEAAEEEEGNA